MFLEWRSDVFKSGAYTLRGGCSNTSLLLVFSHCSTAPLKVVSDDAPENTAILSTKASRKENVGQCTQTNMDMNNWNLHVLKTVNFAMCFKKCSALNILVRPQRIIIM